MRFRWIGRFWHSEDNTSEVAGPVLQPAVEVGWESDWITVSAIGQNRRAVCFNCMTGQVWAGCFLGSLDAFVTRINRDYGERIRIATMNGDFMSATQILGYQHEYLAAADFFKTLISKRLSLPGQSAKQ